MAIETLPDSVDTEGEPAAFALSDVVAAVLATSSASDPHALALVVLSKIEDADLRVALGQILPSFIGDRARAGALTARQGAPSSDAEETSTASTNGSAKWNMVAATCQRFRSSRVCPGGNWKRMAECTRAEVLALSATRFAIAANITNEGRRFEVLADAMQKARAKTVADLSDAATMKVLRWQP